MNTIGLLFQLKISLRIVFFIVAFSFFNYAFSQDKDSLTFTKELCVNYNGDIQTDTCLTIRISYPLTSQSINNTLIQLLDSSQNIIFSHSFILSSNLNNPNQFESRSYNGKPFAFNDGYVNFQIPYGRFSKVSPKYIQALILNKEDVILDKIIRKLN